MLQDQMSLNGKSYNFEHDYGVVAKLRSTPDLKASDNIIAYIEPGWSIFITEEQTEDCLYCYCFDNNNQQHKGYIDKSVIIEKQQIEDSVILDDDIWNYEIIKDKDVLANLFNELN